MIPSVLSLLDFSASDIPFAADIIRVNALMNSVVQNETDVNTGFGVNALLNTVVRPDAPES
jgi:hypothetical protein